MIDLVELLVGPQGLHVASYQRQARVPDVIQVIQLPAPQIVDHDQAFDVASPEQTIDQVRADKSGAAGDEH